MGLNAQGAEALATYNGNATRRSIPMSTKAYGSLNPTWNLPHAGIPTSVLMKFSGQLEVTNTTAVGTVTASPMWPFTIMGPSTMMDYVGITRILADGWDLFKRDMVLGQAVNPKDPFQQTASIASLYTATIPNGVANATVTSDVVFSVSFPLSLQEDSVLGSFLGTVPDGTSQIILTENALTGPYINSPLTTTGNAKVTLTGNWQPEYYYLDASAAVPIPVAALSQIHEFYRTTGDTSQIVSGGNPKEVLVTGREYYRVFQDIIANNKLMMNQTSPPINMVSFIIDESTPTLNQTFAGYLAKTNRKYHSMFPFLLYDFMAQPWTPNDYGSLQAQQQLSNAVVPGDYQNYITTRETLYVPSGNLVKAGG